MQPENFKALKIDNIDIANVVAQLSKNQRERLLAGYNLTALSKVFDDSGLMHAVDVFLQNGMNVSRTAKILYMHRNTLIYKLNSVLKQTGFDLRDFNVAVTFKILHTLYIAK